MRVAGYVLLFALGASATVVADEMATRKSAAMAATKDFVQQLGGAMQKAMKTGGASAAVQVCSELAPSMTSRISRENGWRVTRVGTRVRNPLLGMPDAWEQTVLADFARRAAAGEPLQGMRFAAAVEEPNGRYFRFMQAIGVKPPCLRCHGPAASLSPEVAALLKERYPHDRATGYQVGDLRGAVSIKQPMP